MGFVVAPGPEPLLLDLSGGGFKQDEGGIGSPEAYLLGPLEIDLEEDVATGWRGRDRGPVQVPEEFGPFEEPSGVDFSLEGLSIDEDVGVLTLTGPACTRRP
jgi:hypothetical protein